MTEAVRLARNLDTVEANIRLFGKIMDETDIPGTENANDKKLLEKLDGACHKMQERLTILLSELDPENYENVFMNGLRNSDTKFLFMDLNYYGPELLWTRSSGPELHLDRSMVGVNKHFSRYLLNKQAEADLQA